MRNSKKFYFILGIILIIIFTSFFLLKGIIFKPEQPLVVNDEIELLKQIFPDKLIIPQEDQGHYIIDGKDYYVKKIGDLNKDNSVEFVLMERIQEGGKKLSFYSIDLKAEKTYLLLDNIIDFEWYSGQEDYKNREIELFFKDITADGINEIIVPYERNAKGNRWYQILTFDEKNKTLIKMLARYYQEEKPTEIIGFDEIEKEGEFVVMTWHGTWSRGKAYYSIEGNILNFEKGVRAEGQPDNMEYYEYQEIDKQGNIVYKETRQGSIWTDSLSR